MKAWGVLMPLGGSMYRLALVQYVPKPGSMEQRLCLLAHDFVGRQSACADPGALACISGQLVGGLQDWRLVFNFLWVFTLQKARQKMEVSVTRGGLDSYLATTVSQSSFGPSVRRPVLIPRVRR